MSYPEKEEEVRILDRFTEGTTLTPKKVMSIEKILAIQSFTTSLYADAAIKRYVTDLVDATRDPAAYGIDTAKYIAYGASPRASIGMILGAKAHALLEGRGFVLPEDVKAVAHDVLRHRIILTYEGEAEGITRIRSSTAFSCRWRYPEDGYDKNSSEDGLVIAWTTGLA